jgi:hypothetical protein
MAIIIGDDGQLHASPDDGDPIRQSHHEIIDQLAFKFELDQQVQEALAIHCERLDASVAELAARMAMLETLIVGSPGG